MTVELVPSFLTASSAPPDVTPAGLPQVNSPPSGSRLSPTGRAVNLLGGGHAVCRKAGNSL